MANVSTIRYFDVTVDKDAAEDGIKPMLCQLKPEWQDKRLCVEEFTEGKMNQLLCYSIPEDADRSDAVIVRVHLVDINSFVPGYTRQVELSAMQLAYASGCFPTVYASFNNGVIYKYCKGRTLNFHDITNPEMIAVIAKKICHFNMTDVDSVDLVGMRGETVEFEKIGQDLEMVGRQLGTIPQESSDPSRADEFSVLRQELDDEFFQTEYDYLHNLVEEMQMEYGLAHGDFHCKNMVYDEVTGDINFIDYEIAGWTHRCQDLARLFSMRYYMEIIGMIDPQEPEFTQEIRELWLRRYLEAQYEREIRAPAEVSTDVIELLDIECSVVDVINDFRWMPFAFMNIPTKDMDILALLPAVKARYYPQRARQPQLRTRYLELKEKIRAKK